MRIRRVSLLSLLGVAHVLLRSVHGAGEGDLQICEADRKDLETSLQSLEKENEILKDRIHELDALTNMGYMDSIVDGKTLLEDSIERIKSLISELVPETDSECKFDYTTLKCLPRCACRLAPKPGDFAPSRMCRLIPEADFDNECDPDEKDPKWMEVVAEKIPILIEEVKARAERVAYGIKERAPPSDDECTWSMRNLRCEPREVCAIEYQVGDYNLDRMCRLRLNDYDDNDLADDLAESADMHWEANGEL